MIEIKDKFKINGNSLMGYGDEFRKIKKSKKYRESRIEMPGKVMINWKKIFPKKKKKNVNTEK